MSRLYDTVEPSVIDDVMLKTAVEKQGPQEEAGNIARKDGLQFEQVKELRLDFLNILRIENLWQFDNLTKLQFDNNIIEKIEGIETLTNLIWLDLSFNNIEKIEGLDTLVNLTDLSLFNNRIGKLENMDKLEKLQVFSIGNNLLNDYSNIVYLRRFKSLKTLCLRGNPFCEKEDYHPYVLSFLPQIVYLDYRMIDKNLRNEGLKKFEIDLGQLSSNEEVEEQALHEKKKHEQEKELNKEAYVEGLNNAEFFHSLYTDDPEGQKLNLIPGADELINDFHDKFVAVCKLMYEYGIKEKDARDKEVGEFWKCLNEAKLSNTSEATQSISLFMEIKKRITDELNASSEQGIQDVKLNEYNDEVNKLWEKLMMLEVQVVDQLEEAIRDFERNMNDMVNNFVEVMQGYFAQIRDAENMQFEKLQELAIITLERVIKNEVNDEFPEELRDLFIDKDTVVNAIQTSHEAHQLKIDNKEDSMISKIKNWLSNMMDSIHDEEEYKRNRSRVMEINRLVDYLKEEIYDQPDLQD